MFDGTNLTLIFNDNQDKQMFGSHFMVLKLIDKQWSYFTFISYLSSDLKDFENVCAAKNGTVECSSDGQTSSIQKYLIVFMIANALHGAGSTPMFTLGTSYIDENSRAEQTPLFLGRNYAVSLPHL